MLAAAAGDAAVRGSRFFAVHSYRPDRAESGAYAAALAPYRGETYFTFCFSVHLSILSAYS